MTTRPLIIFLFSSSLLSGCSPSSTGIFAKKTPHEKYGQGLTQAGLAATALGRSWFNAASKSLASPLDIALPYQETGYFAADKPAATGLKFAVKRGEKIAITLEKKPANTFTIYLDLWQAGEKPRFLASTDSASTYLEQTIKDDGQLIVRLQPELLQSGEYSLRITAGPSLAFPIAPKVKANIGSLWGADRDAGARSHEGIDIFAPKHSPAVASGDGLVGRVNENRLGGKVVFLHLTGSDYTLYYAHLDSQMVSSGQSVRTGDTLGLTGNTGNARNTPSHLHFGIYTRGGPINPYSFVNPLRRQPSAVTAPVALLNTTARLSRKVPGLLPVVGGKLPSTQALDQHTVIDVLAATENWFRVALPDGREGFLSAKDVVSTGSAFRKVSLKAPTEILDRFDSSAARKTTLPRGSEVSLLGRFNAFYLVQAKDNLQGWVGVDKL